ncbi:hypothetical protein EYF80_060388 [Liparis tanakae]|uniref:Uncharacterized protein n=1 Tax=Liparis tanakae TaxID=230148 RepID=A0A4Z2EM81_9TELE|nr:hypothetical protein EYF80_060388 [Liparis tanakae]
MLVAETHNGRHLLAALCAAITASYLRPRLASVKLHPLWFKAGETGSAGRLGAPSSERKAEASGEEGKDGEEAKGAGGDERRGDRSSGLSGPRAPLSPPRGEAGRRFWRQSPAGAAGPVEKESQRGLPRRGSELTCSSSSSSSSSSSGDRYLISDPSTWNSNVTHLASHDGSGSDLIELTGRPPHLVGKQAAGTPHKHKERPGAAAAATVGDKPAAVQAHAKHNTRHT